MGVDVHGLSLGIWTLHAESWDWVKYYRKVTLILNMFYSTSFCFFFPFFFPFFWWTFDCEVEPDNCYSSVSNILVLMEQSYLALALTLWLSLNGLCFNFFGNFWTNNFCFVSQKHQTEFWGGKGLLKLKALNLDWEKGAVMLKDSKGSKAKVENEASVVYNIKKVGLGFICRDNTLLSNDNKTLGKM